MLTLQSIFNSGWIQIVILLAVFWFFSRWTLTRAGKSGYAIGWLVGSFFIVAYCSMFPNTTVKLSVAGPTELGIVAVFFASFLGAFIGFFIIGITYLLRDASFRQIFSVSGITSILVLMLFAMIISTPQVKMALTLASLTFAIVIAIASLARRAYLEYDAPAEEFEEVPRSGYSSRLERIREQATGANSL